MIKNMDIGFYDTLDLRQRFFVLEFHEEAGDQQKWYMDMCV